MNCEASVVASCCRPEHVLVAAAGDRYLASLVLGLLLASFIGLQALLPLGTAVKIGADEDFELSKATLCIHGYKLYTDIWDDQPPLDTSIVISLVRHVSPPILGPRLFSVGLALILLSALFILVARLHGTLAAGLATAMVLASPGFIELSSSCMQEVPALAPNIAALSVLVALPSGRWRLVEVLAGLLFGFGLQLKLIGVVYLPLGVLVICLKGCQCSAPFKAAARSAAILLATAAVTFVGLNWLTGNPLLLQLQQSWGAHFSSAKSFEYGSPGDRPFDWTVLPKNWDTTIPALAGVFVLLLAMRRSNSSVKARLDSPLTAATAANVAKRTIKNGVSKPPQSQDSLIPSAFHPLLPLAWLVWTLIVFTTHKPWWSYYFLHNSVPLCWCGAIGFVAFGRWLCKSSARAVHKVRNLLAAGLLGLFCAGAFSWMAARVYLEETGIRGSSRLASCLVLKEIARFKLFANFLFAYDPIYSFHSDIPAPPHLAMISLKRLWSGEMTNARLVSEIESAKPGLILLPNNAQQPPFQDLLNREYRLVYEDAANLLYAHRSISRKPFSLQSEYSFPGTNYPPPPAQPLDRLSRLHAGPPPLLPDDA